MLDIKFLVENTDKVKEALSHRNGNFEPYIDSAVENEKKRKQIIAKVETLKATRNTESDNIAKLKKSKQDASELIASMQQISAQIKELDAQQAEAEANIRTALLAIPNIPSETCPVGLSDAENVVVRSWGEPTKFDFEPQPHWTIGEKLNIFDWTRAGKISGARFTVYRGLGAKLERALITFMLDTHTTHGYTEILPPYIVNRASMTATGQLPKFEEDAFALKNTDYFLIPTAEVPVTNLHRDEILSATDLPVKYCSYTACFRAEAGSAGRDTRGIIRQHQFNKVELVKFVRPEESYDELEKLTADAERILQLLKLPYHVSALSTGDLGFSSAKTYDLEVWLPSYNKYMEISSCSNFESYQARRGNIRFRDTDGKLKFVHTLNGSGLAIGRTVAAIIENYQNADGSVTVPDALVPYMGCSVIK
ncbi:MAG: serine--tRNA ligase [Clostridiales bacterium]|nr:serine--tRNA ligase [Clostridiales bacterium]MDD6054760.1 serine--tRNA ligase [Clostridiales bacterium]MDD7506936.1 serine--tRNA ligase [Clostridiales bacterium]MDY5726620.1 serine--tRNA ligase [Eubacteriales bacterium]